MCGLDFLQCLPQLRVVGRHDTQLRDDLPGDLGAQEPGRMQLRQEQAAVPEIVLDELRELDIRADIHPVQLRHVDAVQPVEVHHGVDVPAHIKVEDPVRIGFPFHELQDGAVAEVVRVGPFRVQVVGPVSRIVRHERP